MFKGELTICSIIFFSCFYLYTIATGYKGHEIYGKLGPGFWPKFILICMMVLSLWVALDALRSRKKISEKKSPEVPKDSLGRIRFFSTLVLMVAYFFFMNLTGFILLTPFFLIAFMYLLGEKSWFWMMGLSLGMTILVVMVFTHAMYVPLPRGVGIFHQFSILFY